MNHASLIIFCVLIAAVSMPGSGCSESRSAETAVVETAGPVFFTDVTEEAGLGDYRHVNGGFGEQWMPETVGPGLAVFDYDNDDWQDILVVGGGGWPQRTREEIQRIWMYRNNGDGTFADVTEATGFAGVDGYPFGVTAADYDNDGDQDVFVATLDRNLLFRNDDGRFTECGREAGLADQELWSASALFFDADRDGLLDLYVTNYVDWSPENAHELRLDGRSGYSPENYDGVASAFYRNVDGSRFENATEEAGLIGSIPVEEDKGFGVAELDFNHDGWPDLYVTHDTERNQLFENHGGVFTERAVLSGVAYDPAGRARAGMGADAGVVDSSGHVSIFVGNFAQEMVGLYTHLNGGVFADRSSAARIGFPTLPTLTFTVFLADLDLDTDLDLVLGNGDVNYPLEEAGQRAQIFLNEGDGTFEEMRGGRSVLDTLMVVRGSAYIDHDRDGDLDVLFVENSGGVHLWRNDTGDGVYLRLHLRGVESNRDGLGTRVLAEVGGLVMERRVRTGSSFLSVSEKPVTFGLGEAGRVDRLVVMWPSGREETFEDVEGGQELLLVEGSGRLEVVGPRLALE